MVMSPQNQNCTSEGAVRYIISHKKCLQVSIHSIGMLQEVLCVAGGAGKSWSLRRHRFGNSPREKKRLRHGAQRVEHQ